MFKKRTLYLSAALLTLPLVANAADTPFATSADLRPILDELRQHCSALPASLDENAQRQLQAFYAQRDGQRAWQSSEQRLQLHEQLTQLADDGLQPSEYELPNWIEEQRDCVDVLTSHSYLQALLHLRRGRLLQQHLEPLWQAPGQTNPDPNMATLSLALLHLQAPAAAFASARPATVQYQQLRSAYAQQRLQPLTPWVTLPSGPLLKPERQDARLPALRARLFAQGYLATPGETLGNVYDGATQLALEHFQRDHGLNPDGILGPASLTELNISAQSRREQLRANLERLRWLAEDMRGAEVLINVAAGELQVVRDNQLLWRSRTQVGRAERQTPLLASRIERLTLNPTWTVPPTILREDKLPAIRDDISYLERHQMSVLDHAGNLLDPHTIDWERPGAILLRQSAGSHNPLGRVVLRFANPFAVYLHDTPSQHLFSKAPRAFSSGCVRVEAVDSLLAWLLTPDELKTVQARIVSGDTQQYRLQHPAPLLIAYWTAEASADGALHYYPDIYGRDGFLIKALAQPVP
ncbi:L,D-transpeptidase family protein [Pseudomonas sp. MIL19]|uniref:L,D-transpeptidase family protein n=1 Tax=Pseudomonas sp. MIL19 TaxID=2976979 RepID=UPI0023638B23|nr:L,D-transpeptidase family protein [Pseudomonas sp. MIL19]MDD2159957.1 L,D-transpeptidase family protein [Pseudomonas sp. MIL19]